MKKTYGKIQEEVFLEESLKSREIVKEILKFGVTQYQIAKIIYLLSMELENINVMKDVYASIDPLLNKEKEDNFSKDKIIT